MPLKNRVTPFSEIIAVPDRGTLMGNRGCLHNDLRQIIRHFCSQKSWIACLTDFKDRKRELMTPGHYTELFFLDEATAFSPGHRPCGECRRTSFRRFKAAWLGGNPQAGLGPKPTIKQIDAILNTDRLTEDGKKRIYRAAIGDLPDGVMVSLPGTKDAFLLWRGRLHHWTAGGYDEVRPAKPDQVLDVLTPRTIVAAIRAGYVPAFHPSVT
jgi:hypothetical protein